MPAAILLPLIPGRSRGLGALLLGVALGSLWVFLATQPRSGTSAMRGGCCHPNLSRLRDADGREIVLIGTLALDLDGISSDLVNNALERMQPEVVMVEGHPHAGVNAMVLTGRWEIHGAPPVGVKASNWSDIGDAEPVEIVVQKPQGWRSIFAGPPPRWPDRSYVPLKVEKWSLWLRGSVGADVAAAATFAAANSVPLRFLGPHDGGQQGHIQVSLLAQRALSELLSEEHQRGQLLPQADVDAALHRAENHVRQDAAKWLEDVRSTTAKLNELVQQNVPNEQREAVIHRWEEKQQSMALHIQNAMDNYRRGAVVLNVDQLVGVEGYLIQAGFSYVSECA